MPVSENDDQMTPHSNAQPSEPMFNLPAPIKWISLILILMHIVIHYFPTDIVEFLLVKLVYIPVRYSNAELLWFDPLASFISPIGYTLVHSGWLHLFSNVGMFLAFGTALYHMVRTQRLLLIWVIGAISGVLVLTLIDPRSQTPVLGASGAISAILGALLYFSWILAKVGIPASMPFATKDRIMTFLVIWIGMNLLFIFVPTGTDGDRVAWEAHLAGFASGIFSAFCLIKLRWLRF